MLHADDRFSDAVARRVADIEAKTDAEVVVVAAERSGSYRDVSMVLGACAALVAFMVLLALPWSVHPVLAVADLAATFAVVTWVAEGIALPVRLAGAARRRRQVHEAAAAAFHLDAVHATPHRLALLLYVSAAERQVEVVPDIGLEVEVPLDVWAKLASSLDATDLDAFLRGLDRVGEILATHAPATAGRVVGLADAPRVRS
jgi:putative membrane protein